MDIGFTFLAGVLTIFAPCILPMLPILLGGSINHTSPLRPLLIIAGFVLSFSALTLMAGALTRLLDLDPEIVRMVGAVLIVAMGVTLIVPQVLHWLAAPLARMMPAGTVRRGNWGGFLLGTTLGLVWAPCAGPVLATVLVYAATSPNWSRSLGLLASYSLGAGLPMLLLAYGGQYVSRHSRRLVGRTAALQRVFGVLIVAVGVAMILGYDTQLTASLASLYPQGRIGL